MGAAWLARLERVYLTPQPPLPEARGSSTRFSRGEYGWAGTARPAHHMTDAGKMVGHVGGGNKMVNAA